MDENFWVAVSFVIFIYFAYKPVKKAIVASLDSRINDIKNKLLETEKLKKDAENLLFQVKQEIQGFDNHKREMLENAKNTTALLVETREKEIELMLERNKNSALLSLEYQKNKVTESIRNEFIDKVVQVVRSYLVETQNNSVSDAEIIKRFTNPISK